MSIYPEIDNLGLNELVQRWQSPPLDGEEYADLYYQEVADKICMSGSEGIDFLLAFVLHTDTNSEASRFSAVVLVLSKYSQKSNDFRSTLVKCLDEEQDSIVSASIEALSSQKVLDVKQQILEKIEHRSPYVRSSVLRYVSQVFPAESIPLLVHALQDKDYIVRESAIDELDEMEHEMEPNSLKILLEPLLEDSYPQVRQAAQTAIANLRLEDN
jgi:HEAT repeat protein